MKTTDIIFFKCEKCGKEKSKQYRMIKKNGYFCKECLIEKKYGVRNVSSLQSSKEKAKKTNLEKYGSATPLGNIQIKEKAKKTNLEKYGTEYATQSNIIKERIKKNNLKKYGTEYKKELYKKRSKCFKEKNGVLTPFHLKEIQEKIIRKGPSKKYIKFHENYKNDFLVLNTENEFFLLNRRKDKYHFKCKKCNNEFDYFIGNGYYPKCNTCNNTPIGGSFEEDEIYNFIRSIFNGIIERNKKILDKQEIDIFIPQFNIGFEYNGLFWHSEKSGGKNKDYHLNKQKKALEKGIRLFIINSNEWKSKKEIIKSIIASKLKIFTKIIYARKTEIKEVNNEEKSNFLNENHLQLNCNSKYNLGLYFNKELVSIMTFGKGRFEKNKIELYRFCNKKNYRVIGGFNKLLSNAKKIWDFKKIITYSNKNLFDGDMYEKAGFMFIRDSKPNYFYTKNYYTLYNRIDYQKHKLKDKLEIFNEDFTEWENMLINGYDRIWDCGNRVFVLDV